MSLSTEANERLYDALAEAIDRAGPGNEALFLTKLALLLANQIGDEALIDRTLELALHHIHRLLESNSGDTMARHNAQGSSQD